MTMTEHLSIHCLIAGLILCATAATGQSSDKVERVAIPDSDFPISAAVVVPSGYDTIYISGHVPKIAKQNAPKGSTDTYGDTGCGTSCAWRPGGN